MAGTCGVKNPATCRVYLYRSDKVWLTSTGQWSFFVKIMLVVEAVAARRPGVACLCQKNKCVSLQMDSCSATT